ncbi:hypothetical protein [Arthrobacter sp. UM1]|uniref:hypothetical protein n=1 Tax=Arthrobacter sp. UM1 TaxID=2766776 RepID=UPI001CF70709|nr:hypothetical protein [Arthrobacter sp. UM1]MCB4208329.1 hypothetical protein [Arthrobacter sp. UM1]
MPTTPLERLRSTRRWLRAAGVLAVAALAAGLVLRPFIADPMPAAWLSPGSTAEVVRRDSLAFFAYPLLGLGFWVIGAVLPRALPSLNRRLAPLPARASFLLVMMCANIAVLGWLQPQTFNAWLGIVYLGLLVGLVANHIRAARGASRSPQRVPASPARNGRSRAADTAEEETPR